ncbi:MAG: HD domain-containing phosphohydrolase [Gammaproteobacteria bacterium]|jgi:HD-GYP domain-containing protein (c-di-GMP phosphodiesterase class II)
MTEESLKKFQNSANSGFYAHHLSKLSESGNRAYTTSDVVNDNGVLIARKGITIDDDVRNRLLKHKLFQPLDTTIGLEQQADSQTLIQEFRKLMDRYPDLQQINTALEFGPEFEKLLKVERLHPVVTQKLTVLNSQMPSEFEKSIFTAWLSTMIAREIGLGAHDTRDTLVAALIHDLGFLHLDPDIVCSNRKLTAEEWNTVRAHVIVGKIIAESIPGISPEIPRAVIQHHENCFGSGYPYAINADELGLPGRIIGMTDSIHSIRTKTLRGSGRTLGDIRPFLQLNPETQGHEVYRATMSIIKKSDLKPLLFQPDYSPAEYAKLLGQKVEILGEAKESLDNIHQGFSEINETKNTKKEIQTILAITHRMRTTIHESGLLSHELAAWLNQERDTGDIDVETLAELNEVELLIKELTWQMRNSVRMFQSHHHPEEIDSQEVSDYVAKSIVSIQDSFDRLNKIET